MSLLEAAMQKPVMPNKCWAQRLPDDLKAQLAKVEQAYQDGTEINRSALTRELQKAGIDVQDSSVARHFRNECRCTR